MTKTLHIEACFNVKLFFMIQKILIRIYYDMAAFSPNKEYNIDEYPVI